MNYRLDGTTGNAIVWGVGENRTDEGGDVIYSVGHTAHDVGYVIASPMHGRQK